MPLCETRYLVWRVTAETLICMRMGVYDNQEYSRQRGRRVRSKRERHPKTLKKGSGTPDRNGVIPPTKVVHRQPIWVRCRFVRRFTRDTPETGATQLSESPIFFYPVTRSSCRKIPFAEALLSICCCTQILSVRHTTERVFLTYRNQSNTFFFDCNRVNDKKLFYSFANIIMQTT